MNKLLDLGYVWISCGTPDLRVREMWCFSLIKDWWSAGVLGVQNVLVSLLRPNILSCELYFLLHGKVELQFCTSCACSFWLIAGISTPLPYSSLFQQVFSSSRPLEGYEHSWRFCNFLCAKCETICESFETIFYPVLSSLMTSSSDQTGIDSPPPRVVVYRWFKEA